MSENTTKGHDAKAEQVNRLLEEFAGWRHVVDRGGDEFDLSSKAAALYQFAIANQHREGVDLLNEALIAFETASADR